MQLEKREQHQHTQETEALTRAPAQKVVPAVDIFEGPEETWLVADLPGVARDALHVELENDELRVSADAHAFDDGELFQYTRAFRVPLGIDPTKVTADLKDGVLTLKLPKPAELKPRKIDVHVS